jgi:hypothetical protein
VIRLAGVEVHRFVWRRLTQVLVVLLLVAIAITGVIVAVNSRPPSAEDRAQAERWRNENVAVCRDHPRQYGADPQPGETPEAACERAVGDVSDYVVDRRFELSSLHDVFLGTSFILAALGLVLGASFIGAEWHWGTIATLLTWEPRRVRVLLVKVAVIVAATFVLFVAVQAVLGLVLALVAATRGTTEGTGTVTWFRSVGGVAARSAALGAFAAAVGIAIATVGRNTAAALGVGFVWFGVVEGIVRGLRPAWQRWLVGDNAAVFLSGVDDRYPPLHRTTTSSGLLLLAYAACLVAVAVGWFRARDLT